MNKLAVVAIGGNSLITEPPTSRWRTSISPPPKPIITSPG